MIPFNKPYMTGRELGYIERAHASSQLSGDGEFTRRCNRWLEQRTGTPRALLTHSCTAALEMAAFLLDVRPGDEIIMPSFTFVSTANAFVIRGATLASEKLPGAAWPASVRVSALTFSFIHLEYHPVAA